MRSAVISAVASFTLASNGATWKSERVKQAAYRALGCIFLYSGNDGMNTVVPTDTTRYGQYQAVRKTLALPQSSLVGLGSTGFGLHPAMAALAPV